jgi:hypothetical protein
MTVNRRKDMKFEVLIAGTMYSAIFWALHVVCIVAKRINSFGEFCYLYFPCSENGGMFLGNVTFLPDYTTSCPRRLFFRHKNSSDHAHRV